MALSRYLGYGIWFLHVVNINIKLRTEIGFISYVTHVDPDQAVYPQ